MNRLAWIAAAATVACAAACAHESSRAEGGVRTGCKEMADADPDLVGAWRSSVKFKTGAFSSVEDLEFMYSFQLGGTLTESSNYDSAPPVPPAYGVWRRTGPSTFEARYEFYMAKSPASPEQLLSGGWPPAGRGVLRERIELGAEGRTYRSTIRYEPLDAAGKPAEGGGEAEGRGIRIEF